MDSSPPLTPKQSQKWQKFLRSHNFSETWLWQYWRDDSRPQSQINKKFLNRFSSKIRAQKEMKDLMRHGVPPEQRGAIWWVCSGGAEKMKHARAEDSYSSCLQAAQLSPPAAAHDIMKDLHRTFVSLTDEASDEDILPLKNVLLAYSVRNKIVGYCQSMNFITALLLMHLTEEQAFWILAALVEDILPSNYYTMSMIGCRMDQAVRLPSLSLPLSLSLTLLLRQVFQSCLAWKLPKIFSHFKSKDMILEPITCSWFLCLYINCLPLPGPPSLAPHHLTCLWRCVADLGLCALGRQCCSLSDWFGDLQTNGPPPPPCRLC
jgi:hypothetical protein